jgi:hypothetical protein
MEKARTEHAEQVDFVRWFRLSYPEVLIFAIPNGGHRSPSTANRLKAEGVVRGVPDLYIPAWGLWVEMKRTKGGSVSADQKSMMEYLEKYCRHQAIVAKGSDHAKEQIAHFVQRLEKW